MRDAATATLTDCAVAGNSAAWGGALYAGGTATVFATRCTLTANRATFAGGAVAGLYSGAVEVVESTLASNWANAGGAIVTHSESCVARPRAPARAPACVSTRPPRATADRAAGQTGVSNWAVRNPQTNEGARLAPARYVHLVRSVVHQNTAEYGGAVTAIDDEEVVSDAVGVDLEYCSVVANSAANLVRGGWRGVPRRIPASGGAPAGGGWAAVVPRRVPAPGGAPDAPDATTNELQSDASFERTHDATHVSRDARSTPRPAPRRAARSFSRAA